MLIMSSLGVFTIFTFQVVSAFVPTRTSLNHYPIQSIIVEQKPTTTAASLFFLDDNTGGDNDNNSEENIIDCLVVGGGISGSTLAYNLHANHDSSVLLAEARDYIGGNVKSNIKDFSEEDGTEATGRYVWEDGPNSFATQPSIVRIASELNIAEDLVFADESLPPWVNHNGKLHPLPKGQGGKGPKGQIELVFGPNGVLKFGLVGDLLSWPGKIRAGIGALVGHAPPPDPSSGKEETIREWVTRTLGEEVFLRCIDPFVSGVYAGDPEKLSMKASLSKIARIEQYSYNIDWNKFGAIFYGGLARQVELTKERKANPPNPEWPEFEYGNPGSFKNGLSTLPNAIHAALGDKVKTQWKLVSVDRPLDDGIFLATFDTPTGQQKIRARTVVSTIPAHVLSDGTFDDIIPSLRPLMSRIRSNIDRVGIHHPPVAAVTVSYPKSSFRDIELPNGFGNLQDLPGFGSLNPRSEGVRTLGTLWTSSLFPGRCPPDHNLLLNYIGGSRDPNLVNLSEEEIVNEVDKGCRSVLVKDNAPPPLVLGVKIWPKAIPQYELGHLDVMKELEELERKGVKGSCEDGDEKGSGIWISGNYRTGVAFPDCVTYGYDHAKVVKAYLDEMKKS